MPIRYTGVSRNILDAIGDTPLVEVEGVYAKLEFLNPSGSIKARIAAYMIERAEREGLLKPGDTIVEATSGNTGNALAMVAAVKDYKMLVVMPEGLSGERVAISRAYGAEVLFCGNFHVNAALAKAQELGSQPGYFSPRQFESEWNIEENREVLGPEILAQLPHGVLPDALVAGVGTGGTLIGVGQAFRAANPDVRLFAMEPSEGGTLIGVGQAFRAANPDVRLFAMEPSESSTLLCGEVAMHQIEGIADGFVPGIFQRNASLVDEVLTVSSAEAIEAMTHLARHHGLFCGPSSGACLLAAKRVRERHPELATVVTLFCDKGEKYLQEHFMRADTVPVGPSVFH